MAFDWYMIKGMGICLVIVGNMYTNWTNIWNANTKFNQIEDIEWLIVSNYNGNSF